eukprot:Rmarinus@m.962
MRTFLISLCLLVFWAHEGDSADSFKAVYLPEDIVCPNYEFDVVVAHCHEDLGWLSPFLQTLGTRSDCIRLFIHEKCGEIGLQVNLPMSVRQLVHTQEKNLGFEALTYASHIWSNYDDLANFTIFLQGDPETHLMHDISLYAEYLGKKDFGFLGEFMITFDHYGFPEAMHIGKCLQAMWAYLFPNKVLKDIFHTTAYALFYVSKDVVHRHPHKFYEKVMHAVDGTMYIAVCAVQPKFKMEAGVLERLWEHIFTNNVVGLATSDLPPMYQEISAEILLHYPSYYRGVLHSYKLVTSDIETPYLSAISILPCLDRAAECRKVFRMAVAGLTELAEANRLDLGLRKRPLPRIQGNGVEITTKFNCSGNSSDNGEVSMESICELEPECESCGTCTSINVACDNGTSPCMGSHASGVHSDDQLSRPGCARNMTVDDDKRHVTPEDGNLGATSRHEVMCPLSPTDWCVREPWSPDDTLCEDKRRQSFVLCPELSGTPVCNALYMEWVSYVRSRYFVQRCPEILLAVLQSMTEERCFLDKIFNNDSLWPWYFEEF